MITPENLHLVVDQVERIYLKHFLQATPRRGMIPRVIQVRATPPVAFLHTCPCISTSLLKHQCILIVLLFQLIPLTSNVQRLPVQMLASRSLLDFSDQTHLVTMYICTVKYCWYAAIHVGRLLGTDQQFI